MSYKGDVEYEVWRAGRNPDRLDPDRIEQHRWNGRSAEEAASAEMRRWSEQERMRREQEAAEAECYRQLEAEQQAAIDADHGGAGG